MKPDQDSLIKVREIVFCSLHPDLRQAHTAAALLADTQGILSVEPISDSSLKISYRLPQMSLARVEQLLTTRGFHLDNRLLLKLKRALWLYGEETQQVNLGMNPSDQDCTSKIFASNYRRKAHGCRDDRPSHWRRYL